MTVTGRSRPKKASLKAHGHVPCESPEVVARQSRVEELRQLVVSGKYKVEPQKLAMRILVRALQRDS